MRCQRERINLYVQSMDFLIADFRDASESLQIRSQPFDLEFLTRITGKVDFVDALEVYEINLVESV